MVRQRLEAIGFNNIAIVEGRLEVIHQFICSVCLISVENMAGETRQ